MLALLDYPSEVVNTEIAGHLAESVMANSVEKAAFWRTPQKDEGDIVAVAKANLPSK